MVSRTHKGRNRRSVYVGPRFSRFWTDHLSGSTNGLRLYHLSVNVSQNENNGSILNKLMAKNGERLNFGDKNI